MKIAGITWWKNNYGSILQSYALGKVLETMEDVDYELLQQFKINSFSLSVFSLYLKENGPIKTISDVWKKFGNWKLRKRKQKCEEFILKNMKISSKIYNASDLDAIEKDYDGFICGSDQIWNPSFNNCNSIYWLNFSNNVLKIAYAPSIGVTEVSESLKNQIRNALKSFNAISCRENSGTLLINNILGEKRCKTVLDPTLLLSKDEWDLLANDDLMHEEYVFSYILRGNDEQRLLVKKFAKEKNLKLVTIPFLDSDYLNKTDGKYADIKFIDASPQDFIGLIKGARYIFTDSFHCMIFSCIYHRTFFSLYKYGSNQMLRIRDFQNWLDIGDRVVTSYEDIIKLMNFSMDSVWENFDIRVSKERKESLRFLSEALKSKY